MTPLGSVRYVKYAMEREGRCPCNIKTKKIIKILATLQRLLTHITGKLKFVKSVA